MTSLNLNTPNARGDGPDQSARVRRILLRPIQDQVVTQYPHGGAIVSSPTLTEACDLMLARRALEGNVMALALRVILTTG